MKKLITILLLFVSLQISAQTTVDFFRVGVKTPEVEKVLYEETSGTITFTNETVTIVMRQTTLKLIIKNSRQSDTEMVLFCENERGKKIKVTIPKAYRIVLVEMDDFVLGFEHK